MLKNILTLAICLVTSFSAFCQSFWFGPKGALAINVQQWNGFERDPYISFNGDIFIETEEEYSRNSFYSQLGLHTRGSSTRINLIAGNISYNSFKFNNLVLEVGAKQKLTSKANSGPYYLLALRGEYTLSTNFSDFSGFNSAYYPIDDYVNKFNYGVTVGGGWEFIFSELVGGIIEFVINPDLSKQYEQYPIANVISPITGNEITLPERIVRNLSFEIKFGLRFMRKVEYLD